MLCSSALVYLQPLHKHMVVQLHCVIKKASVSEKKKRVSPSVLTDAVQTVVSIGNFAFSLKTYAFSLLKYWVPPINFAFSHKTFALSRKKYCVTPRNFAFSHKSAKIKIVLQVNNVFLEEWKSFARQCQNIDVSFFIPSHTFFPSSCPLMGSVDLGSGFV